MKKIVLSLLLLVLVLMPLNTFAKPGDANNDGTVNALDLLLVKNHLSKKSTLTGDKLTRADVTGDRKVTAIDFLYIKYMGLKKSRQICKDGTSGDEIISVGQTATIGIVAKDAQKWGLNGNKDAVKITDGKDSSALKKGELPTIKAASKGKVQITVLKSDGNIARCNVIVIDNTTDGWQTINQNEKIEWGYYQNGFYKNTIQQISDERYYFDNNGVVVKNKEITFNGSKYLLNAEGQVTVGCVNGKYYSTSGENYGKYQKTCTDTSPVKTVSAKTISITASKTTIGVGEKIRLSAKMTPVNVSATTKWSSNNTGVVTVDKYGIIEGVKAGAAIITAKNGSKSTTVQITVSGTFKLSYQDGIAVDGTIQNSAFGIVKNATSKASARATNKGINSALAKAKAKGISEVKLEPGVYVIDAEQFDNSNSGIVIPSGITLNLNGSVIKLYTNNLYWHSMVKFTGVSKSGIKNGILEGDALKHKCLNGTLYKDTRKCFLETSHERGAGIRIWNSKNITIENMEIYDITGDGINIGSDEDNTKNITIKNNDIYNARRQGITISCANTVTITGNKIHDIYGNSPESAIDLESGGNKNIKKITITNNKMYNNGYYYNTGLYDVLLAANGNICDVKITNNEYVSGIRNNNEYILNKCTSSPKLDTSNNKIITF